MSLNIRKDVTALAKQRYLRKIILTYFSITYCLVMAVLLVFSIYVQLKNASIIGEQEESIFKNQVQDYEHLYEDMFNISNDIREMPKLDLFALSDSSHYYSTMTQLQQELNQYSKQYQRNGYGIMVHRLHDNKMITERVTIDQQYYLADLGLTPSQYAGFLNEMLRNDKRELLLFTDDFLIYISNKNYLSQDVVITVHVSLSRVFPPDSEYENFSLIIQDAKVKDLRSNPPAFSSTLDPDSYDYGAIYRDNVDHHLSLSAISRYYSIVYHYVSPSPLYSSLYSAAVYIFLVLLAAAVLIVFLIIGVSKIIYRPIRELVSTVSDTAEEAASPANSQINEMDFLLGKVKTIQLQNQELIETADAHKNLMKQSLLIRLLSNTATPSSMRPILKDQGLAWLDSPCTPIIFDTPFNTLEDPLQYTSGILIDLLKSFFSAEEDCIYIELTETGVLYVSPSKDLFLLQENMREAFLRIEKETNLTFSAYIAPESKGLEHLSMSYNIAVFMREEHGRLPLKNIYLYEDYKTLFKTSGGYPFSIERDLINAAEDTDWEGAEKIIDEIFDIYICKTFHQKNLREMNVISLLNTINRSMQRASVNAEDILPPSRYLILELKMASSPEELRGKVKEIYRQIISQCEKKQQVKSEDLNNRLQNYIENHYSEDISLNDLAEWFGLSPNYMSLVFKNIMECNFKEYLSKIRCQKARELMEQNQNLKISEIAAMVGIQNVNTFIRVFKKDCGISPGQYLLKIKSR